MKILLYGGSFDPPHNGHLNNLRAAADRVRPDKIVVMPAGTSPFKEGTNASGALRLEMCRCFAALAQEPGMPPLEVSGWEVAQAAAGSRNYTVLTLEMLARENPGAVLYLAIGSDMLLSRVTALNDQQMQVCYLMRIGMSNPQIRNITDFPRTTIWRWTKTFSWIKELL